MSSSASEGAGACGIAACAASAGGCSPRGVVSWPPAERPADPAAPVACTTPTGGVTGVGAPCSAEYGRRSMVTGVPATIDRRFCITPNRKTRASETSCGSIAIHRPSICRANREVSSPGVLFRRGGRTRAVSR